MDKRTTLQGVIQERAMEHVSRAKFSDDIKNYNLSLRQRDGEFEILPRI